MHVSGSDMSIIAELLAGLLDCCVGMYDDPSHDTGVTHCVDAEVAGHT